MKCVMCEKEIPKTDEGIAFSIYGHCFRCAKDVYELYKMLLVDKRKN